MHAASNRNQANSNIQQCAAIAQPHGEKAVEASYDLKRRSRRVPLLHISPTHPPALSDDGLSLEQNATTTIRIGVTWCPDRESSYPGSRLSTDLSSRTAYKPPAFLTTTPKVRDKSKGTMQPPDTGTSHSVYPLPQALRRTQTRSLWTVTKTEPRLSCSMLDAEGALIGRRVDHRWSSILLHAQRTRIQGF